MLEEAELNRLLQKRADYRKFLEVNVDLIPIDAWGFDEDVKAELRTMKHKGVNNVLSAEKKQAFSKAKKQQLARGMGLEFRTVTDVLKWLASQNKDNLPSKFVKTTKNYKKQKIEDKNGSIDVVNEKFGGDASSTFREKSPMSGRHTRKRNCNASSSDCLDEKDLKSKAVNQKKTAVPVEMLEGRELALQRLQAKVKEMEALRRGKMTAEQYEDKRKLKRRISKLKMKERKKLEKQKSPKVAIDSTVNPAKRQKVHNDHANAEESKENLVFSKFDYIVRDKPQKVTKTDKRDKFAGKDYKRLLDKAEKRAERIEAVRAKNPDKAARIADNIQWKKAMSRAEGNEVKDNVELLKKSLQKKMKLKEWRKKKWEKRVEHTQVMQEKRREKRTANIQARKDAVKKKKLQKARKKGRIL